MSENKGQKIKNLLEILFIIVIILGFGGGAVCFDRYVRNEKPKAEKSEKVSTLGQEVKDAKTVYSSIDNSTGSAFSSQNPINEVQGLLSKYGFHMTEILNIEETQIPVNFKDKDGEIPLGLYWAYCNELSKAMGLDFSKNKGERVKRYVINVSNDKNQKEYAVVVANKDKIIGAWLLGQNMDSKTLDDKNFKDVVATVWETWLMDNGYENYNSSYNLQLRKLSPEQVIEKYFECISKKDYKSAFMLFSKYRQSDMIARAATPNPSGSESFNFIVLPFYNAMQIKISDIYDESRQNGRIYYCDNTVNRRELESKEFTVQVNAKFGFEGETSSGYYRKVGIDLVRESKDAPWQIENVSW